MLVSKSMNQLEITHFINASISMNVQSEQLLKQHAVVLEHASIIMLVSLVNVPMLTKKVVPIHRLYTQILTQAILLLPFLLLKATVTVSIMKALSVVNVMKVTKNQVFIQILFVPTSMNVTTVIQTLEIVEREPVSTMIKDSHVHVKLDTNQLKLIPQLLVSTLMTALLTLDDAATVFAPIQTELTHVIAISDTNLMELILPQHVSTLMNAMVQLQRFFKLLFIMCRQ